MGFDILEMWAPTGEVSASPAVSVLQGPKPTDEQAAYAFYRRLSEALWDLADSAGMGDMHLCLHRISRGWPAHEEATDADVASGLASAECQSKTARQAHAEDDVSRLQLRLVSRFLVQASESGRGFYAHINDRARHDGHLWRSLTLLCQQVDIREMDVVLASADAGWVDCVRIKQFTRAEAVKNVRGISDMPPVFGPTVLLFAVQDPDRLVVGRS